MSRHQLQRKGVVTSFSGRDNICKRRRSRQQLAVATSAAKERGRDKIKLSRHQLQRLVVATSLSSRDNRNKKQGSRQHLVVATTAAKTRGSRQDQEVTTSKYKELSGDVSKLSLQQLHRTEGRDII